MAIMQDPKDHPLVASPGRGSGSSCRYLTPCDHEAACLLLTDGYFT